MNGERIQFQTTKMKIVDAGGVTRLLGMCVDVSEMTRIQQESQKAKYESLTYSRIAAALSTDYVYLYYINVKTDAFIEYRSAVNRENLSLERKGADFFRVSLIDAERLIYKDDRSAFLSTFNKENFFTLLTNTVRLRRHTVLWWTTIPRTSA